MRITERGRESGQDIKEGWMNLLPGMLPGCICDINHGSLTVCVH